MQAATPRARAFLSRRPDQGPGAGTFSPEGGGGKLS